MKKNLQFFSQSIKSHFLRQKLAFSAVLTGIRMVNEYYIRTNKLPTRNRINLTYQGARTTFMILLLVCLDRRLLMLFCLLGSLRIIDDVVDGEIKPKGGVCAKTYLHKKEGLVRSAYAKGGFPCSASSSPEDIMLIYAIKSSMSAKIDIRSYLQSQFCLFRFDLERRKAKRILQTATLLQQASRQDTYIFTLVAQVLGGNAKTAGAVSLRGKGLFTRIDWLRDLLSDMQRGIMNIPQESVEKYQLDLSYLARCITLKEACELAPGFLNWYQQEFNILWETWQSTKFELIVHLRELFPQWLFQKIFLRALERIEEEILNLQLQPATV